MFKKLVCQWVNLGVGRGWVVNTKPRSLYRRERPGPRYIEGWLGPRAGLGGCGKSRPHRDSILGPSSPWRVTIPTEISDAIVADEPSFSQYVASFEDAEVWYKLAVLFVSADESDGDSGVCGTILTALSWLLIICTLPFSLCVCFKVRRFAVISKLWPKHWAFLVCFKVRRFAVISKLWPKHCAFLVCLSVFCHTPPKPWNFRLPVASILCLEIYWDYFTGRSASCKAFACTSQQGTYQGRPLGGRVLQPDSQPPCPI